MLSVDIGLRQVQFGDELPRCHDSDTQFGCGTKVFEVAGDNRNATGSRSGFQHAFILRIRKPRSPFEVNFLGLRHMEERIQKRGNGSWWYVTRKEPRARQNVFILHEKGHGNDRQHRAGSHRSEHSKRSSLGGTKTRNNDIGINHDTHRSHHIWYRGRCNLDSTGRRTRRKLSHSLNARQSPRLHCRREQVGLRQPR